LVVIAVMPIRGLDKMTRHGERVRYMRASERQSAEPTPGSSRAGRA
jgi:hypothetical protein